MKAIREIAILVSVLAMVQLSAGYSFSAFQYQDSAETRALNQSFRLGLINPSDQALRVNLSAETPRGMEVDFPDRSFVLEPSKVTEDPEGSGWYSAGDGRYVKIKDRTFYADISEQRSRDRLGFSVRVEAVPLSVDAAGREGRQSIVQVREYGYTVEVVGALSLENQTVERGYTGGKGNGTGKTGEDRASLDRDRRELENSTDRLVLEVDNKTVYGQEKQPGKEEGGGGIDPVTYLMALGTGLSVLYLWRLL